MPSHIPPSLKGLRVRLISSPAESRRETPKQQRARQELKQLLDIHAQHLSKKILALFRQSLNGLLLHGLRARPVDTLNAAPDSAPIYFKASDGKMYKAPSKAWSAILKADPDAKAAKGR